MSWPWPARLRSRPLGRVSASAWARRGIAVVVGAGVFASAEDALGEWRDAVGPAASGAALSPCAAGMTARLAAPCLQTGVLADMLQGPEPRELIREYYRLRRRARDLTGSADTGEGSSPFDAGHLDDAFLDWYATRHDDVPEAVAEATGTILSEWGPHENPDERSFYACSPHRIEMAAHLIREGCFAGYANPALRPPDRWPRGTRTLSFMAHDLIRSPLAKGDPELPAPRQRLDQQRRHRRRLRI
jgi:hypothetical protein